MAIKATKEIMNHCAGAVMINAFPISNWPLYLEREKVFNSISSFSELKRVQGRSTCK